MSESDFATRALRSNTRAWCVLAMAAVVAVALGLRFWTSITTTGPTFDEHYSLPAIHGINDGGWTVKTAIDFEETKGPGLIWPYALCGQLLGGDLNTLRWLSVAFFVAGAFPLLGIAAWAGLRRWQLVWAAVLYALLPHIAVVSQLVMSEPSFVSGSLLLMWLFVTGLGAPAGARRTWCIVLAGVVLCVLLHNRVHAVAFAGAMCLVAFERERLKSWPWWLMCAIAGATRVPLWLRWGGLVSPVNQDRIGLATGIRLESLTYLAAALCPLLALLAVSAARDERLGRSRWLIAVGGFGGLMLGVAAMPPLDWTYEESFSGFVSTFVRSVSDNEAVRHMVVAALAMIGGAGIGGTAAFAFGTPLRGELQRDHQSRMAIVNRLLFWSIAIGWSLYGLTYGYVFDRYTSPWCILLPIVMTVCMGTWLRWAQAAGLAAIFGYLVAVWLVRAGMPILGE